MENATRRIRKARRQGLARRAGASPGAGTRASLSPTRGEDFPHEPRANERRKEVASDQKPARAPRSRAADRGKESSSGGKQPRAQKRTRRAQNVRVRAMDEHFVITADQGHLRIFQERRDPAQATPALEEVQAMDFPTGIKGYTERDTDMAGRFQSSKQPVRGAGAPTARTGMSIDERLPMQREMERRRIRNLAEAINGFLASHPKATWDFAAGPGVHNAVLAAVSARSRGRLRQAVRKDLVHQATENLRAHFARD
jgi:hypothetical protein